MDGRHVAARRLLGVPADSDPAAVAQAYRRLARATHPDVSADPEAAKKFAALAAAYRLLSAAPPAPPALRDETAPPAHRPRPPQAFGVDPGASQPPLVAGPVRIRPYDGGGRRG